MLPAPPSRIGLPYRLVANPPGVQRPRIDANIPVMATALPTGTVTFLFTDIEGSTGLLRRSAGQYAAVLDRHHELLDTAVTGEGGVRMSDDGDGGYFVFHSPGAAIRAAWTAQNMILAEPWPDGMRVKVRMGIHAGEADLTDDRRYVGLAVHLAARIGATGHGGQVLVSAVTHALAKDSLPTATLDLGEHLLSGFPEPVGIVQLGTDDFPPLRAAGRSSLPTPLGSFVGRERERREIADLIQSSRVVTILGPGGTGKTRLALETARALRGGGRSAHFIDLTTLSDPRFIPTLLSAELGLAEGELSDGLGRISAVLDRTASVVVLDNCEHLLPEVGRLANELVSRAPSLRILATSRAPLGLPGERRFELDGLDTNGAAVQLFRERAEEAGAELDSDEAVGAVCARLDGLPLALELAAPLAASITVSRLAEMLDERLDVLSGTAVLPDRHRTMAATVEWSIGTLSAAQREAFERLGVMVGPFDLDDAAAVIGVDAFEAIPIVGALCDRSLVKRAPGGTFSLLETLRWFARQALERSGALDPTLDRHLEHFRTLAVTAVHAVRRSGGAQMLERIWRGRSNLLAAFDHAIARGNGAAAVEIVEGMVDMWGVRGAGQEARMTTDALVTAVAADDVELMARALLAQLEIRQAAAVGKNADPGITERLSEISRIVDDPVLSQRALVWRAGAGRIPAEDAIPSLEQIERDGGHRPWAIAAETVAWLWWWRAEHNRSFDLFERVLRASRARHDVVGSLYAGAGVIASARTPTQVRMAIDVGEGTDPIAGELGASWWQALRYQWMACPWLAEDGPTESAVWLDRAYRIAADHGTTDQLAFIIADQAVQAWNGADPWLAHQKIVEFAHTFIRGGDSPQNPFLPEMAAAIATVWGHNDAAIRLLGAASHWRSPGVVTDQGMPMPDWDRTRYDDTIRALEARVTRPALDQLLDEGRTLSVDRVLDLVISLEPPDARPHGSGTGQHVSPAG